MNERNQQFRVGVVAVATVVITAILIAWHSDFSSLPFAGNYQIKVRTDRAPGVSANTPVRRRGILIGRVDSVEATDEGAVITLSINEGQEVKDNEQARIATSIIGDATLEFVPVRPPAGNRPIPPGGTAQGMYVPTPVDMLSDIQGDLKQTIQSLGAAGQEVAKLANQLNEVLGENDLQRITHMVESLDSALVEFRETLDNVNDIVGDEEMKKNLREGLTQLPALVDDARAIMEGLERVAGSADKNLQNLTGLTKPLGERGNEIVASMEKSVRNLEELLGNVAELSANINNSEGTLGLLIKDRELYDTVNGLGGRVDATAARVDLLINQANAAVLDVRKILANSDLSWRIKQILANVADFTDKIARDPARIARGVIDRETPIK
ncbi:MAG: MCE family protein [Planctomycetales bacterium]|nr:MCE family protein [Planctomycetales bacterium]